MLNLAQSPVAAALPALQAAAHRVAELAVAIDQRRERCTVLEAAMGRLQRELAQVQQASAVRAWITHPRSERRRQVRLGQ